MVRWDGAEVDRGVLEAMGSAAAHRGPDGSGVWVDGGVGLGHARLAVEGDGGAQPLVSADGGLVVVADARVDNAEELLPWLRRGGWAGDRPVGAAALILAAYRCWGQGCAARLLGDFAFVVWDVGARRLFAARDAMGMRPLYYRLEPRRVLFASEVKQLLADPQVPVRVFEPMVAAYLAGAFNPLAWTFYEGVAQLPPAHMLTVEAGARRVRRYWDIDPDRRVVYGEEADYAEHFRGLFAESVRARLLPGEQTGLLLSGGMDSGSIAATAGWLGLNLRTYSWAFEELAECDERTVSRLITDHYGLPAVDVPADERWPLRDYPAHGPDRDEPFFGVYQALLEHALAMARADGVRRMLLGNRGDLLVGDWVQDHWGLLRARRFVTLAHELRAQRRAWGWSSARIAKVFGLAPLLPAGVRRGGSPLRLLRKGQPPWPAWIRPEFANRVHLDDIMAHKEAHSPFDDFARRHRYELIFLPMHMRVGVWTNRTSARFGQEFADPWSDRRLVEYVLAIPQWVVQRPSEPKRLARQAMRGVMPEAARTAVRKVDPSPLYRKALRDTAAATFRGLLSDTRCAALGWLDEAAAGRSYVEALDSSPPHDPWWPVSLESWLRTHWAPDN